MSQRIRSLLPTLLCMLFLPFCAIFIHPWAEMAQVDDFSYTRSAQLLAHTGHIVYNGWATAMLGWQLYLGALMIKLFGFSMSTLRVGTLLVAILVAALLQRLLVRMGTTPWNAAAITLTMMLSSTWLGVTFSFMSDIYGMLVLFGCCYACVRALQASTPGRAAMWVCAAALSNGVGGTARQIAWLGVLVMVPCTLWLLRKNRLAAVTGLLCTMIGITTMIGFLHWFNQQPYALAEHLLPPRIPGIKSLVIITIKFVVMTLLETLLLAMPVLIVLSPTAFRSRKTRRVATSWILLALLFVAGAALVHKERAWEIPYGYSNFTYYGFEYYQTFLGTPSLFLTPLLRHTFLVLLLAAQVGFIAVLFTSREPSTPRTDRPVTEPRTTLTTYELVVLLGPCTLAYLLLLLPRFSVVLLNIDRYILIPQFILLLAAVLLYQRHVSLRLPRTVWLSIALFAAFYVAGLRDTFTLYQAQVDTLQEVEHTGVPREAIDGGFAYNAWTQIMTAGYMNDSRLLHPANKYHYETPVIDDACRTYAGDLVPVVHGRYAISMNPNSCGGATSFAPRHFSMLFAPHDRVFYIVKGPAWTKQTLLR
ncbi:MAG: hypothetical protein PW792_16470 [Acidobacteriaceae bacterium]|nr:hypothetical protein [Acidobacteriaceae bacterium]